VNAHAGGKVERARRPTDETVGSVEDRDELLQLKTSGQVNRRRAE
jgi:hypothetical protein